MSSPDTPFGHQAKQQQLTYTLTNIKASTMPGYTPLAVLPPFSPAVTEEDVKSSPEIYQSEHVIHNLLHIAGYLVQLVNDTTLFGPASHDPYTPSLKTLLDRLHAGHLALTPLPDIAKDASRLQQTLSGRWTDSVHSRPLEDFEDVYYAVLARMQDMQHTLNARLSSGFNDVHDALFAGGPSIADFAASMAQYWGVLNAPACARALDDAVRQARVTRLYEEIHMALDANVITQADADELLADLFESKDTAEGMKFIGGWSPAMIGGYLHERYRVLLQVEKEEGERQAREMRKRARMKVKVRKERRKSPMRRSSLEMMLEGARERFARLREDDGGGGGSAVYRPSPGKQVRFAEQVEDAMRVEAHQVDNVNNNDLVDSMDHNAIEQERARQDQLQHDIQWQLKSQRVSEYSSYLRGAASHDVRSIVNSSAYGGSVRGSSLGRPAPEIAEKDTDMMEF